MKRLLLLSLFFICFIRVFAQWGGTTSGLGTPLTKTPRSESSKISVTDGANGAITVFEAYLANSYSNNQIFVQRINSKGLLMWSAANSPKTVSDHGELYLSDAIPDGKGGIFIAWEKYVYDDDDDSDEEEDDEIEDVVDIYIQHIDSSGKISWGENGVKLNDTTLVANYSPRLCLDNAGGIYVTWYKEIEYESNDSVAYSQVFIQRLNSLGVKQWDAPGIQVVLSKGFTAHPEVVSDGAGGAIVVFIDTRNSPPGEEIDDYDEYPNLDIYAQRIGSSGSRQWTDAGAAVCTEPNSQYIDSYRNHKSVVSDSSGGAIIVFMNHPDGNDEPPDLYAQKINEAGVRQWALSGITVSSRSYYDELEKLLPNGSGGVIVVTRTSSNGNYSQFHAQQLNANGNVLWGSNGIELSTSNSSVIECDLKPDGLGNYIAVWNEYRNTSGSYRIKAQKIDNSGVFIWDENGLEVVANPNVYYLQEPSIVPSDSGTSILIYNAHLDYNQADIYAKKISANGKLVEAGLNQTITFAQPADRNYGDAPFQLIATSSSGLPVSFEIISGPGYISGKTFQIYGVGNVTIRAIQHGDSIFNAAKPVERTFCIRPAIPSIISGSTQVCFDLSSNISYNYTVSYVSGATYTWTLSGGGKLSSNENYASVIWDSPGSHTLRVKYNSDCATIDTLRTLNVQVIQNSLTGSFTNMLPSDGNSNLSLPLTFSWYPVQHATSYDLYIWPETAQKPASPTIRNISGINYTIASTSILQYEKVYKWQVVARQACYELPSNVQTFRLRNLPDLVVAGIQNPSNAFSGQQISISYQIKNSGLGGTLNAQWFDNVYLSTDSKLDPIADLYLGQSPNSSELNPGVSYSQTTSFALPQGINGNYYVIIVAGGGFPESNQNNNILISSSTTFIQLTPPPDLQVVSIVPPNFIFSGETIDLTYKVANKGTGETRSSTVWYDVLYISKDPEFNGNAHSLGSHYHSGKLNVNEEYTRTQSVSIPQHFFGRYYFYVKTDHYNQVYEHAAENNNTTRSDSVNIILKPPVDLMVTDISALDSASNKEPMMVQWTVENAGGSSTGNHYWVDRIYLSKQAIFNKDSSIRVADVARPNNLEAGEAYNRQATITMPQAISGQYYVYIKADADSSVFEHTFESNNVNRSSSPVKVLSPDLIVSDVTIPLADSTGKIINIKWKVRNRESGITFNSSIRDRISISKHPVYVVDSVIEITTLSYSSGQLSKGDSLLKSVQGMLPNGLSGNYYIYIETDRDNSVFEAANESNNISRSPNTIKVNLSPWPDLVVTGSTLPDSALANDFVPFAYAVKNKGIAKAGGTWRDRIYLTKSRTFGAADTVFLQEISHARELKKDSIYSIETLLKIPPTIADSTKYYVFVVTDAGNNIYEHTDEANNSQFKDSIFIKRYPPVDLVLSAVTAPDSAGSGMPITLTWAVDNKSAVTTLKSQWYDGLYLSKGTVWDRSKDIFVGELVRNGILGVGQSYTATHTFTIPNGVSGAYYLTLVSDHQLINNDANRANNYRFVKGSGTDSSKIHVTLTSPPDLVITSFKKPDQGPAGQPIWVKYSVKNNGLGPTRMKPWTDKLFISTNLTLDASDQLLGSKTYNDTLKMGGEYTDSIEVFLPIQHSGNYVLILTTDANDNIYEHTGENNNTATGLITVVRPLLSDLVVSNITNPPVVTAGDSITVQWNVKNIGANSANGYMKEAVYLSEDTVKSADDVLLVSERVSVNIPPQTEIRHSYTSELKGVSLKDYHVLVHTDVVNNIYESDDGNNISASVNKTGVSVPLLPINLLTQRSMRNHKEVYYRIVVPDSLQGESLLVTLKGDSLNGANELYLRHGDVPTRAVYDFSHSQAFAGNHEIIIPALKKGTYYLMAYGQTSSGIVQQISLLARILQFEIRTVDASTGGNAGKVTVEVSGSKLDNVNALLLRRSNTAIKADSIMVVDPTKLFVRFNLKGASVGDYDVIAKKPNGDSAVLVKGFKVAMGTSPTLLTNVVAPPSTRPSNVISISVEFTNAGNTDLVNPVLKLSSLGGAPIAFDTDGLASDKKVLTLALNEVNGPPGVLRPGAKGTIIVYAKATTALSFTLLEDR